MVDYDVTAPLDVRVVGERTADGVVTQTIVYRPRPNVQRAAFLIGPEHSTVNGPAILYVHWLESFNPTSNRTQFLAEAQQMAQRGATSLLIETMWSDSDWFIKRTQADDYAASIEQVIELRRALDVLLDQPQVDRERVAYVGHDFGAMYGVLMGSIDQRPTHYVLMAGTPRFADWYLYYPRLEGIERNRFIEQMAPLDPIAHAGRLAPAPVLFQFATEDEHVPVERANEFAAAATQAETRWYEAGHGLNDAATAERLTWLTQQLGLAEPA